MEHADAISNAKVLYSEILTRYGAPHYILTDLGANFLSSLVQVLCDIFSINTLRPRQNGRHFTDMLKRIFLNENIWISNKISYVPWVVIDNISEFCFGWRQAIIWTNDCQITDAYMSLGLNELNVIELRRTTHRRMHAASDLIVSLINQYK